MGKIGNFTKYCVTCSPSKYTNIMNKLIKMSAFALLTLGLLAFTGCEDDPMDDAADNLEDAAENVGDAAEDVGNEVGEATEDATESVEDATD